VVCFTDAVLSPNGGTQRRKVEQLPRAGSAHLDEGLKLPQVTHRKQLPHITLQKSGDVIGKPILRRYIALVQRWIDTLKQGGVKIGR
jgi:hypothetical protein